MARKQGDNPRRRYTAQEREVAVAEVRGSSLSDAARKLGIPHGTLHQWMKLSEGAGSEVEVTSPPPVVAPAEAAPAPAAPKKRKLARRYTPSEKAVILEYAAQHGVMEASTEHAVSRFSIYDWQRKLRLAAEGRARRPPRARTRPRSRRSATARSCRCGTSTRAWVRARCATNCGARG